MVILTITSTDHSTSSNNGEQMSKYSFCMTEKLLRQHWELREKSEELLGRLHFCQLDQDTISNNGLETGGAELSCSSFIE